MTNIEEIIEKIIKDFRKWSDNDDFWPDYCIEISEIWLRKILIKHLTSKTPTANQEVLLWEDLPYKDDLGCRIYGYVKDWIVNITRVEYINKLEPQEFISLKPWEYMKDENWNIITYEDEQREVKVDKVECENCKRLQKILDWISFSM